MDIHSQTNRDILSTEAYINNHKAVSSQMLALSTLEVANTSLHNLMRKEVENQSDIEDKLNKYYTAFEIIDVALASVQTLANGYLTYQDVKELIPKYTNVLDTYREQVKSRHRIELGDTIIYTTAKQCLKAISSQIEYIALTMGNVAVTFASPAGTKTATMLQTLRSINESITLIGVAMRWLYDRTWHYVNVRRVYFSRAVVQMHTKQEICNASFSKWREKQKQKNAIITIKTNDNSE